MRMWMVDPKIMCRKHLMGEHVEIHMIVGSLIKGRSIQGFIDNNCIDYAIYSRHANLAEEIIRRGYKHNSPLLWLENFGEKMNFAKVNQKQSLKDLLARCPECKDRYFKQQCSWIKKIVDKIKKI